MGEANYRIPLPPAYGPKLGSVPDVSKSDKVAKIGHCIECHTPMVRGRRYYSRTGLGGQVFHGPWSESIAANITPDKETGLGKLSDAQIKRAIADGSKLRPPMAFRYSKNISDDELNALVAYLRSLKPFNNAKR